MWSDKQLTRKKKKKAHFGLGIGRKEGCNMKV